jgi:hypothetical protein
MTPQRPSTFGGRRHSVLTLFAATMAVLVGASAGPTTEQGASSLVRGGDFRPTPVQGVPLTGPTGLKLLVANNPPFVLDADTGHVTRVRELDVRGNPILTVVGVGKHAVVWLERRATGRPFPEAEIYLVRANTVRAARIATAWEVAPSVDGAGVWLKAHTDRERCALREIALDGSPRTRPWSVPCSSRLVDAGGRALLLQGTTIVEPASRWTLARAPYALALSRTVLVTATGRQGSIVLTNLRTGKATRLAYPSRIRGQGGFDEAVVDPSGRFVALSFADPAYELSGTQVTDAWLLDTARGTLRQLPDVPAAVSLKFTSMQWAPDGRLVILGETGNRPFVASWRPGDDRLAVRRVRLPERTSGSDAFVVRLTD